MNQTVLSLTLSAIMLLSAMGGLMILAPSAEAHQNPCRDAVYFFKAPGGDLERTGVFQPVQVAWHADPGYDHGATFDPPRAIIPHFTSDGISMYASTNDISGPEFDAERDFVWTSDLTQIVGKNTLIFNHDLTHEGTNESIFNTRLDDIIFRVNNAYTVPKEVKLQFVIKGAQAQSRVVYESATVQVPEGTSTNLDDHCNGADRIENPGTATITVPSGVPDAPFQFQKGDVSLVAELVDAGGSFYDKITLNLDVKKSIRTEANPFKILIKPLVFKVDYNDPNNLFDTDWYNSEQMLSEELPKRFKDSELTEFFQASYPLPEDALKVQYEKQPIIMNDLGFSKNGVFLDSCKKIKSESVDLKKLRDRIIKDYVNAANAQIGRWLGAGGGWDRVALLAPSCFFENGNLGEAGHSQTNKKAVFLSWDLINLPVSSIASTLAHEIGHTFSLQHLYGVDISKQWQWGTLTAYGYRVNKHISTSDLGGKVDGDNSPEHHGLMGKAFHRNPPSPSIPDYCPPPPQAGECYYWITKINYQPLLDAFTKENLDPTVITLLGVLNRNDTFEAADQWWIHEGIPDSTTDAPTNHSIRMLDVSGNLLGEMNFSDSFWVSQDFTGSVETNSTVIFLTLELPDGTSRIDVSNNTAGRILHSRYISMNAPVIDIESPSAGDVVAKGGTIQWNAADSDGDSLYYSIQLSADDGENWTTLASGLTSTSFILDPLLGFDDGTYLVKVFANDGVLWSEDVSDSFTLLANSTDVVITSDPSGAGLVIDGTEVTTPHIMRCQDGHNLSVEPSLTMEAERARLAWLSWSDGAERDRQISCDSPGAFHLNYETSAYDVTITTEPEGLEVQVNGEWHTTPTTLWLSAGEEHTFSTNEFAEGFRFNSWSDGSPMTHTLAVDQPLDLIATFSAFESLTVEVTASITNGTVPLSVTFSATVSGGEAAYEYAWDFGDGSTGSGETVTHQYTAGGGYTVTLVATDAHGLSAQDTILITVSEANATGPDEKKAKDDDESFIPGPGMMSLLCALVLATLLYRKRNS